MGRSRSNWGCFLAVSIVASSAWSQDGSPPREVPAQNPLSTVQDSFEASMKKKAQSETEIVLPKFSLPELSTPSPGKPERPAAKPSGVSSRNWLVDAVVGKDLGYGFGASPTPKNSPDRDPSNPIDPQLAKTTEAGSLGEPRPGNAPDKTQLGTRLGSAVVENPLATFMQGWISTQDQAVLLGAGAGGVRLADRGIAGAPAVDESLQTARRPNQVFGNDGSKNPVPPAARNPYLDFPEMGAESQTVGTRAYLPAPSPAPVVLDLVGPPSTVGSRQTFAPISPGPTPRVFSAPDTEAKYFKQLKRF